MLKSFAGDAEHIILAIGATDFRKQITSLSSMVTMQYHMDPFADGYVLEHLRFLMQKTRNPL